MAASLVLVLPPLRPIFAARFPRERGACPGRSASSWWAPRGSAPRGKVIRHQPVQQPTRGLGLSIDGQLADQLTQKSPPPSLGPRDELSTLGPAARPMRPQRRDREPADLSQGGEIAKPGRHQRGKRRAIDATELFFGTRRADSVSDQPILSRGAGGGPLVRIAPRTDARHGVPAHREPPFFCCQAAAELRK